MHDLSKELKTSNPRLAAVATELGRIADNTNRIPDKKTVDIVVRYGFVVDSLKSTLKSRPRSRRSAAPCHSSRR